MADNSSSVKDFYNDTQSRNNLSKIGDDLSKFMPASFAGVPFYYIDDSIKGGVKYNEQSVATGTVKSLAVPNGVTNNLATTEIQFTSQKAEEITIKGFVSGIQAKADLIKVFRSYNNNYVTNQGNYTNSNATPMASALDIDSSTPSLQGAFANPAGNNYADADIKAGKAKLVLPTLTIPLVIVADYSFKADLNSIGYHEFTATFAALPDKVDFFTAKPSNALKSYSMFAQDGIIEKAIQSIKDFNLSTWLNNGIDYYQAFLAKYKDITDTEAAAQNIRNTAETLQSLTSGLLGDSNTVSQTISSINQMIKDPLSIASDPVTMLSSVGKLFTNLSQTSGNTSKRKNAYKNIINNQPKPFTNAPYNGIKITNQIFIQEYIKSLAFINYTTELLNTTFSLTTEVKEAHQDIYTLFVTLNPSSNLDTLVNVKNNAIDYLNVQGASAYNLVKVKINPMAFTQFLYETFGRVDFDDAQFIKRLNPKVDVLNWHGEITVPQR